MWRNLMGFLDAFKAVGGLTRPVGL